MRVCAGATGARAAYDEQAGCRVTIAHAALVNRVVRRLPTLCLPTAVRADIAAGHPRRLP